MYGGPPGRRPHGCGSRLCRLGGFMTRCALALSATALAAFLGVPAVAQADIWGTTFESTLYTAGQDIDHQAGWSSSGTFDANVVNVSGYPNASGYGFGSKALQISNFFTDGAFANQTFTPGVIDEAGEADSSSDGMTGGLRQSQFKTRFRIGAADPTTSAGAADDRHLS